MHHFYRGFSFPNITANKWKMIPTCYRLQLCSVLQSLPPLAISSNWSQRWLLDLLLETMITPPPNHHKLPIRYLLLDIVYWEQDQQYFFLHDHRLPKLLQNFVESLPQADQDAPTILTLNNSSTISIPVSHTFAPSPLPKSRLPSLSHWTLRVSAKKHTSIPTATLAQCPTTSLMASTLAANALSSSTTGNSTPTMSHLSCFFLETILAINDST